MSLRVSVFGIVSLRLILRSFVHVLSIAQAIENAVLHCASWKTAGVTVAGLVDELHEPVGLFATRDGTLYVADRGNHRVMKYTASGSRNGTQIGDGRGSGPRQLDSPNAIVVNEATNAVYISDYGNSRVQVWNEGGTGVNVWTVLGNQSSNSSDRPDFSRADDMQLDPQSNDTLYILDTGKEHVSKWKLSPIDLVSSFRVRERFSGIHVNAEWNVYMADCDGNHILRWPNEQQVAGTSENGSAMNQLNCPSAVVVDAEGHVFIADTNNHRIMLWRLNAAEGVCITGCSATRGNRADQLDTPRDVIFDWEGNLLVADTGNNRVQRFDVSIDLKCGK